MNDIYSCSKNCAESRLKSGSRLVRENKKEQSPSPGFRCMALFNKLEETHKYRNLCRHLLGRAHLL